MSDDPYNIESDKVKMEQRKKDCLGAMAGINSPKQYVKDVGRLIEAVQYYVSCLDNSADERDAENDMRKAIAPFSE